jgi:hypothetical protein
MIKNAYRVDGVFVDGADVLRAQDGEWDLPEEELFYLRTDPGRLNKQLSEELVVPSGFLKVTYTPAAAANAREIKFPNGWTVRKG